MKSSTKKDSSHTQLAVFGPCAGLISRNGNIFSVVIEGGFKGICWVFFLYVYDACV